MPSSRYGGLFPVCLALLLWPLAGCANYSAAYPFRPMDPNAAISTAPPGVRYAATLRGLTTVPAKGLPVRQYELDIDLEQIADASNPTWEPAELQNAKVIDDEGREFQAMDVLISEAPRSKSSARPAPINTTHYRVIFEVGQAYRFESIGRANVRWKLRAPGQRPLTIQSTFLR